MSSDSSLRPRFRVIEGGAPADRPATPPAPANVSRGRQEEEQLRTAILALVVEDLGLTVADCLEEQCERGDSPEEGDITRYLVVKVALERIGLRYVPAGAEHDLARPGYLSLTWPDRLVRRYPELAPLRPETHQELALG